ncbi:MULTISPECIES: hypothetical protein [unclassified Sinorhizobium]|uniref:hypothetical protein n=1 Tax=unclassified Sinorhizobium TaxID=2613772 RepID=UPI003523A0EA
MKAIGFKVDLSRNFERLVELEAADADIAQAIAIIAALPASASPFQTDLNLFSSSQPLDQDDLRPNRPKI